MRADSSHSHTSVGAWRRSYLTSPSRRWTPRIISIGWAQGQDGHDFASTYNAQDWSRIYAHSRDDIAAMFDGTDLVAPGIVDCATWRVDPAPAAPAGQTSMILGAVARRP